MSDVSTSAIQDGQGSRDPSQTVRTLTIVALVLLFVSTVGTFSYFYIVKDSSTIILALKAHGSPWGNSEYLSTFGIGQPYNIAIALEVLAIITCLFMLVAILRLPHKNARSSVRSAFVLLSAIVILLLVGNWLSWGDVVGTVNVALGVPFPNPWGVLYRALDSRGLGAFWQYDSPSYWAPFERSPVDHTEFGYFLSNSYVVSYYLFALMRTASLVLLAIAVRRCRPISNVTTGLESAGAGWYPNPNDPSRNLYWDGQQWHTSVPVSADIQSEVSVPDSELPSSPPSIPIVSSKVSSLAVASLVSAFLLPVAVPIVLGHAARRQIKKSQGTQTGSGLAMTALVLGYLSMAGLLLFMSGVIHGTPSQSSPSGIAPITSSSDYTDGYNRGYTYINDVNGESYFSPSEDCSTILQLIKANETYIPSNDFLWTSGCLAGIASY